MGELFSKSSPTNEKTLATVGIPCKRLLREKREIEKILLRQYYSKFPRKSQELIAKKMKFFQNFLKFK